MRGEKAPAAGKALPRAAGLPGRDVRRWEDDEGPVAPPISNGFATRNGTHSPRGHVRLQLRPASRALVLGLRRVWAIGVEAPLASTFLPIGGLRDGHDLPRFESHPQRTQIVRQLVRRLGADNRAGD